MKDFINDYWEAQAKKHGGSHEASWGDAHMIALEIETIASHLAEGMEVLDVGCANGYSTLRQVESMRLGRMVGIDFAPSMIEQAIKSKLATCTNASVDFQVGDIRHLGFPDASFDLVYTTRVLINLPTWDEQQKGILECLRVLRHGGKAVFCEAFWEPLTLLNSIRQLKQLPPLVEHDFNRYLKKRELERFLAAQGLKFQVDDFSSVYYLGSRFLRELVTEPSEYPGYSNPVNAAFFELEKRFSGGGFGIQQAYVVRT